VGDQDQRGARLAVEREHQFDDRPARLGVEVAGRFVGEQYARIGCERARQRHALLLAARQMLGVMGEPAAKANALQPLGGHRTRIACTG